MADGVGTEPELVRDDGVDAAAGVGRGGAENLTSATATGLRWSYIGSAVNAVAQMVYVAVMSRLLSREAFGIMAMAQIAVNFGMYFARAGVTQTLIQRHRVTERDLRVSSTTSTMLGVLIAAIVVVTAPAVADLYDEPDVVPVLWALSGTFVVLGTSITSAGLLRRQMRFRDYALIQVASSLGGIVVGLAAAFAGAGVYSLVLAALVNYTLQAVLGWLGARYPLRPLWDWTLVKDLYSSGTRFSLLRLTEFVGRNIDTVAVGRYLSSATTGVYSRAYTLVNVSLNQYVSMGISNVLFPSFASIQDDRERLRGAARGVLTLAAFMLVPVGAGMSVAAAELIGVFLGPKFAEAVGLLVIFNAVTVLSMLSHIEQMLCESVGDLNRTIAVQLATIAVLVGLLLAVAGIGAAWPFAAALGGAELFRKIAYLGRLRRVLGLPVSRTLAAYVPGVVAAVVASAAIFGAREGLDALAAPVGVVLIGEMAAGGLALVITIRFLPVQALRRELHRRLNAMGLLRPSSGVRGVLARTARMVLGPRAEA